MEIMTKRKRAAKADLPPGTPLYTGSRIQKESRIQVLSYTAESINEKTVSSLDELSSIKEPQGNQREWIRVQGLSRQDLLAALAEKYSIHPLVLEDILHVDQLPKIEVLPKGYFIVTGLWAIPEDSLYSGKSRQISLILQDATVISFSEEAEPVLERIYERIIQDRGNIRSQNAFFCLYSILDAIMDSYFHICDGIERELDSLEEQLDENTNIESRIQQLRKFLSKLRRYLMPLRESIQTLARESGEAEPQLQAYFRDLLDHGFQIFTLMESYRESLTGLHDLYLSTMSHRTNGIMKVLTLISTIFLPLTFLAGLYGMNFHNMPELSISWAYPALLGVMGLIAAGMLIVFRRKKWL